MTIANASGSVETVILPRVHDLGDGFKVRRALPSMHRRMVGPFIFFDAFGPVTFRAGEGQDVRPHPHIGLATLTYLIEGAMVHRDSAGHVQTITPGDVNWMTAGRGIVHSERTEPEARRAGSSMYGQQIWIALPKAREEMEAGFSHHGAGLLPVIEGEGARVTLVAGDAFGATSPVPTYSDMIYADVVLTPGARFRVDAEHVERAIYVVEGEVGTEGQTGTFGENQLVVFKPGEQIILAAPRAARVMLIGGEPLPEKRFIYWNFVSSSQDRIEQAKADWKAGRFEAIDGETEFIPLPEEPRAT